MSKRRGGMKSYQAHRSVEIFGQAAEARALPVSMVSYSDHESPRYLRLPLSVRNVLNPFLLVRTARKCPRVNVLILRDFLTIPLLLAVPALLHLRRRLLLVCHHNLQRAHQRIRDRIALGVLFRLGFRFVLLESDAGLDRVCRKPSSGQVLVLPLGIAEEERGDPRYSGSRAPVIGVVGHGRKEKGQGSLLECLERLRRRGDLDIEVVVGSPSETVRREATSAGFRTIDTTSDESYRAALSECDVLLLNYAASDYYYRPSASITDAIASGRSVVCPDYPIFRVQVTVPVPAGATFRSEADLPEAVREALEARERYAEATAQHREYRSPERIGCEIEAFLNAQKNS